VPLGLAPYPHMRDGAFFTKESSREAAGPREDCPGLQTAKGSEEMGTHVRAEEEQEQVSTTQGRVAWPRVRLGTCLLSPQGCSPCFLIGAWMS
jgi:hypothetical protein